MTEFRGQCCCQEGELLVIAANAWKLDDFMQDPPPDNSAPGKLDALQEFVNGLDFATQWTPAADQNAPAEYEFIDGHFVPHANPSHAAVQQLIPVQYFPALSLSQIQLFSTTAYKMTISFQIPVYSVDRIQVKASGRNFNYALVELAYTTTTVAPDQSFLKFALHALTDPTGQATLISGQILEVPQPHFFEINGHFPPDSTDQTTIITAHTTVMLFDKTIQQYADELGLPIV